MSVPMGLLLAGISGARSRPGCFIVFLVVCFAIAIAIAVTR